MRPLWIVMALFACKSGKDDKPASGSAAPGGGCTHVDICTLIPLADANAKLGLKTDAATPQMHDEGDRIADGCEYRRTGATGRDLKIGRFCMSDADDAKMMINIKMTEAPRKEGQRHDLELGDKAFYVTDPSLHRVDMTIAVGNVLYVLEDVQVEAGQDAAAVTGLTALAATLLKK